MFNAIEEELSPSRNVPETVSATVQAQSHQLTGDPCLFDLTCEKTRRGIFLIQYSCPFVAPGRALSMKSGVPCLKGSCIQTADDRDRHPNRPAMPELACSIKYVASAGICECGP